MRNLKKNISIVILVAALQSCSAEKTLNTDNTEVYTKSLSAVSEGLSPDQQEDLQLALRSLLASSVDPSGQGGLGTLTALAAMTPEQMLAAIGDEVDGLTAIEVIDLSLQRKIERLQSQISSGEQTLAEANAEQAAADEILAQISIENPRYYWNKTRYRTEPVISFTVRNEGAVPVKRIFMHGTVITPGRSIPWIDEDFNYDFSGGLEPGEEQALNLAPNSFGPWGEQATQDRGDLVLELELMNYEGADGTRVLETSSASISGMENALSEARAELAEAESKRQQYQSNN